MSAGAQSIKMNEGGIEMQIFPMDTTLNSFFCGRVQLPEFPGGTTKLIAFAKQKLKYPQSAIEENVEGIVILQFVINKDGIVTGKKVYKSVRKDLDSICLTMLDQMPQWKPAQLSGKAIEVYERWKISFVLY